MNLSLLPNEILDKIQDYASSKSRAKLRRTCLRMDAVIRKRVYYLGLHLDSTKDFRHWNVLDYSLDMFLPVLLKEQCDHRFLGTDEFPRISKQKLQYEDNPKRIVQQTMEKYPNVEVLYVEYAIINSSFFEQIVAAGGRLSGQSRESNIDIDREIKMLHFFCCVFDLPLAELHRWFSLIRIVCFSYCSSEVNWNYQYTPKRKFARLLFYGEDIVLPSAPPYDIKAWLARVAYLSHNHTNDFIKAFHNGKHSVPSSISLPKVLVNWPCFADTSPDRKGDYLAAIQCFEELETKLEGLVVTVSESKINRMYNYFGEFTQIKIELPKKDGSFEFNILLAYASNRRFHAEGNE